MTMRTTNQPTSIRITRRDRALLDALRAHTGLSTIGVIRLGLSAAVQLLGIALPETAATARPPIAETQ